MPSGGQVNKKPTAIWQWGSENLVNESEPDCRTAKKRRVVQQQVQIVIHMGKLTW
jgi:hypothetical protein